MTAASAIVFRGMATVGVDDGGAYLWIGRLVLCACLCRFVIVWQVQQIKKRHLLSFKDAAQPGSKFQEVDGVSAHYIEEKIADKTNAKLFFLHGLGANAFTWEAVMRPMSRKYDVACMAHDRVGFGLTERPQEVSKYTNSFNVKVVQRLAEVRPHERIVLVGHSLGGLTMALAALSMPNVEALVLVAPAILSGDTCSDGLWRKFLRCFTRLAVSALEKCVVICYPLILEFLRTIVYNVAFWKWGVGKSWFDEAKVPNRLLTQYQWPSLVRDWDMGMAHFLRTHLRWAVLALSTHVSWSVEVPTCEGQSLVQKLNATDLPILIVHGSEDILVPVRNSRRLHQQLQNSEFVELPRCGHTPHEETPDQFVQIVGNFVVAQARKKVGDELQ